ncbi:MAG: hypothetical protein ABW168_04990 [Sedimenticola sp.]
MNSQNIYIPNIQKWVRYYDAVAKKTHNSYTDSVNSGVNQRGGSISGSTNNFMVPIDTHSIPSADKPDVKVEMVSPAQQDVERARSEMKRSVYIRKRLNKKKKSTRKISRNKNRRKNKSKRKATKKHKKIKRNSQKKVLKKNKPKGKKKFQRDIFN